MGEHSDNPWRPTVPAMLHMVAGSAGPRLRAAFADAGLDGIRPAQAVALVPLAFAPMNASTLAQHLAVTRQAVAQAVRPLERHGYVVRTRDEVDGRALLIKLTPRGREALRVMRANAVAIEQDWQQILGSQRFAQLTETLQILLSATSSPNAVASPN